MSKSFEDYRVHPWEINDQEDKSDLAAGGLPFHSQRVGAKRDGLGFRLRH